MFGVHASMKHFFIEKSGSWMPLLIVAASAFLYLDVLIGLGQNLWSDENYSHALLVPPVIAFIIWRDRAILAAARQPPRVSLGFLVIVIAMGMLFLGTLGAELFAQRISLIVFIAGLIIYFFGKRPLVNLWAPVALLLLSVPLPQILFTKITFPLQLWASQIADAGVRLFGIPTLRTGNIIEVIPTGTTQAVALEVVEACSGIRSLMTLAALSILLAYFARDSGKRIKHSFRQLAADPAYWHAVLLLIMAVPVAVLTNALRVAATTVLTYYYGAGMAGGAWHEIAGLFVFGSAFILLTGVSIGLVKILPTTRVKSEDAWIHDPERKSRISEQRVLILFIAILVAGVVLNWFKYRDPRPVARQELSRFPIYLDGSLKIGDDRRFPPPVEMILGATDYVMRDYRTPAGQKMNVYIGFYESQRTGRTYHSPQNCLPGSGWEISGWAPVQIATADGGSFTANRYLVKRGSYRGVMVYWYQGRGRSNSSEYRDKAGTIMDSLIRGRSDGALIRVMTDIEGADHEKAVGEVVELASVVAARLDPYVPR